MSYAQIYLVMDKIDRLLHIIDRPDLYSEKDLEQLLSDPEVRAVYDLLNNTKSALSPIQVPDVDAEWTVFLRSRSVSTLPTTRRLILNWFSRNVAASVTICITSLAAVAAVVGVTINYVLEKEIETPVAAIQHDAVAVISYTDTTNVTEYSASRSPENIVFDNQPLETVATRIADFYGYDVVFSAQSPKSLRLYFRWNQTQTLYQVIESLNNFEQIHISVKDKTIKID